MKKKSFKSSLSILSLITLIQNTHSRHEAFRKECVVKWLKVNDTETSVEK